MSCVTGAPETRGGRNRQGARRLEELGSFFRRRVHQKTLSLAAQGRSLNDSRLFCFGFCCKVVLILCFTPSLPTTHFIPFLEHLIAHPSLDPWSSFLNTGGTPLAFPYGVGMLLIALPALLIHSLTHLPLSIGLGATLLGVDTVLYRLLCSFARGGVQGLSFFYALSPFVSFICFIHGQLDLIPTTLLVLAIHCLQTQRPLLAGTSLAWALSAKLNIALAIPFFLIFLWRNHRFRPLLPATSSAFVLLCLILFLPAVYSPGLSQMVFGSPEIMKIYALKLHLTAERQIYVVVVAYLLTLYAAWSLRKMNIHILFAFLGVAFSTLLLLTEASIGWYIWLIPSLALHYLSSSSLAQFLLVLYGVLLTTWGVVHENLWIFSIPHTHSLLLSTLFALQVVITLRMALIGIKESDYFLLSRKPLSIAIAGDSGVGKDTLTEHLKNLFGHNAITHLSGDNYHRWNRHSALWQYTTHLHQRANKIEGFSAHALRLLRGQPILSPQYDHVTGHFSQSMLIPQNDIVILSGLHAFLSPVVQQVVDLKIYMEMDESLRCFLKVRRDAQQRKQNRERILALMAQRKGDQSCIEPQRRCADLIFKILPQNDLKQEEPLHGKMLPLMLQVTTRHAMYTENLTRALIGITGLCAQVDAQGDADETVLTITGTPRGADLALLLSLLAPEACEFIALHPTWEDGVGGLMQLFCLLHMHEKLYLRRKLL